MLGPHLIVMSFLSCITRVACCHLHRDTPSVWYHNATILVRKHLLENRYCLCTAQKWCSALPWCAVMFLLNVYQAKVDPGFIPTLLPHMLKAVNLPGAPGCLCTDVQCLSASYALLVYMQTLWYLAAD